MSRFTLRAILALASLAIAAAPVAGGAHQTGKHDLVAVGAILPPTLPGPIVIVAEQNQAIPGLGSGVAVIGFDPVTIDCFSASNVGPTGHTVFLRGTSNAGTVNYIKIVDDVRDRIELTYFRGTGPCNSGGANEFDIAGTVVVGG